MKKTLLMMVALAGASTAMAEEPSPTMNFLGTTSAERTGEEVKVPLPSVSRITDGKNMTIVVKESSPCGQRATHPSFNLAGNTLRLSYELAIADSPSETDCVATSVFTLHNLPTPTHDELEITEFGTKGIHAEPALGAGQLGLRFVGAQAAPGMGDIKREIVQSRHDDRMTVIVHEPAACGTRPVDATATLSGETLNLGFKLVGDKEGPTVQCVASAVFALRNVPAKELNVRVNTVYEEPKPDNASSTIAGLRFFVGVPATPSDNPPERKIVKSQRGDRMTVVVSEPAACGSRPVEPVARLADDSLYLHFALAPSTAPDKGACVATGVFALHNLPDRQLQVAVDTTSQKILESNGARVPAQTKVTTVPPQDK